MPLLNAVFIKHILNFILVRTPVFEQKSDYLHPFFSLCIFKHIMKIITHDSSADSEIFHGIKQLFVYRPEDQAPSVFSDIFFISFPAVGRVKIKSAAEAQRSCIL